MTASALIRHGTEYVTVLLAQLQEWMGRKGFTSVDQVRGILAVPAEADTTGYERAGYLAALEQARADLRVTGLTLFRAARLRVPIRSVIRTPDRSRPAGLWTEQLASVSERTPHHAADPGV